MATTKQRQAARKNIKKAQEAWQSMSLEATGPGATRGRRTEETPGATGQGEYYHVEVRPKSQFTTFRTQDVGKKGGIQRVAGKRSSGSWDDQKWLIGKNEASRRERQTRSRHEGRQGSAEGPGIGAQARITGGDRFNAPNPGRMCPKRKSLPLAQKRAPTREYQEGPGRTREDASMMCTAARDRRAIRRGRFCPSARDPPVGRRSTTSDQGTTAEVAYFYPAQTQACRRIWLFFC